MLRLARAILMVFLVGIAARPARAQTWDNSGNSKLNGAYNFRQVLYAIADQYGDIGQAAALYGTITFSGTGTYTVSGTAVDSRNGSFAVNTTGAYTISASGYGFLSNPYTSTTTAPQFIYGLVSNGIFVGSTTEDGFNDLFVAAAASSAGIAAFQGSYSLAYMSFPFSGSYGDPYDAYDALATLNPNGAGAAGTMNVTAYAAGNGSTPFTRSEVNVRYSMLNGVGSLLIPAPANPSSGIPANQVLYISADGNFIFGGSTYWDMFVGVRNGPGSPSGLYYQAGLQDDASLVPTQDVGTIYTYFGSLKTAATGGAIVGHQRFFEPLSYGTQDYTYTDSFPAGTPGGYTDSATSTQYLISGDGSILIGFGIFPLLGMSVAVKAPAFSGPGVYLDPTGVQNAASFAPFTASLARGELLFLTGTGLADQFVAADINFPFPKTLGGVEVRVNGLPAAIYYVGPTFIAALVPYSINTGIAQIQVINRGNASNTVSAFMGTTAPGVFVANGYGIAQHTNYTLVTPDNPARPGDTLLIYMTGLGDLFPAVGDGAVGPIPVAITTNTFTATLGGIAATVVITEYVPTIAGDYVLALTVPSGITPGDAILNIAGPDAITTNALLPVAGP